jgi:hypothetical protein
LPIREETKLKILKEAYEAINNEPKQIEGGQKSTS